MPEWNLAGPRYKYPVSSAELERPPVGGTGRHAGQGPGLLHCPDPEHHF